MTSATVGSVRIFSILRVGGNICWSGCMSCTRAEWNRHRCLFIVLCWRAFDNLGSFMFGVGGGGGVGGGVGGGGVGGVSGGSNG